MNLLLIPCANVKLKGNIVINNKQYIVMYIKLLRRGLNWKSYLLSSCNSELKLILVLSLFHTIWNSLEQECNLLSQLCLYQSSGNVFKRRTFPCSGFLSLCLSHSNSRLSLRHFTFYTGSLKATQDDCLFTSEFLSKVKKKKKVKLSP
jgi:hypothetical protein